MSTAFPTARGLLSETEGTQPSLSNGYGHTDRSPREDLGNLSLDDSSDSILLPDGKRVRRPKFPANKANYARVPRGSRSPPWCCLPRATFSSPPPSLSPQRTSSSRMARPTTCSSPSPAASTRSSPKALPSHRPCRSVSTRPPPLGSDPPRADPRSHAHAAFATAREPDLV